MSARTSLPLVRRYDEVPSNMREENMHEKNSRHTLSFRGCIASSIILSLLLFLTYLSRTCGFTTSEQRLDQRAMWLRGIEADLESQYYEKALRVKISEVQALQHKIKDLKASSATKQRILPETSVVKHNPRISVTVDALNPADVVQDAQVKVASSGAVLRHHIISALKFSEQVVAQSFAEHTVHEALQREAQAVKQEHDAVRNQQVVVQDTAARLVATLHNVSNEVSSIQATLTEEPLIMLVAAHKGGIGHEQVISLSRKVDSELQELETMQKKLKDVEQSASVHANAAESAEQDVARFVSSVKQLDEAIEVSREEARKASVEMKRVFTGWH